MVTFTTLPPELRNKIYDLLLHIDHPLPIVSPRTSRKTPNGHVTVSTQAHIQRPEKHFASLIRVSKMIGDEARTSFYGGNTWVLGNGPWGSRSQVNMHALKAFLSRVPHHALTLIKHLHLAIYFVSNLKSDAGEQRMFPTDAEDLEGLGHIILKYFTGIEKIVVVDRNLFRGNTLPPLKETGPAKAMTNLCGLKNLREIVFLDKEGCKVSFQKLVEKIKELEDGKKEKTVVVRVAETKIDVGAGFQLSHWSL